MILPLSCNLANSLQKPTCPTINFRNFTPKDCHGNSFCNDAPQNIALPSGVPDLQKNTMDMDTTNKLPWQENNHDGNIGTNGMPGKKATLGGWLLFFLLMTLLEAVVAYVSALSKTSVEGQLGVHSIWLLLSHNPLVFGKLVLVAYIVISFFRRCCNAVFLGKAYSVIMLVMTLVGYLFIPSPAILLSLLYTVCFHGSFILYLIYSKRVKTLFPEASRKRLKRDYWIFVACIILPILLIAATSDSDLALKESPAGDQTSASYRPGSSDVFDFVVPEGYVCVKHDTGFTVANQGDGLRVFARLYSVLDTKQEPDSCFQILWDKEVEIFRWKELQIVSDTVFQSGGHNCRLRRASVASEDSQGIFYFEFAMIRDIKNAREAAISCLVINVMESPMPGFISSFHFNPPQGKE